MKVNRWSKVEREYLENNIKTKNIKEMALDLNRSEEDVVQTINILGLKKELNAVLTFNMLAKIVWPKGVRKEFFKELIKLKFPFEDDDPYESRSKIIDIGDFWRWAEMNRNKIFFDEMEEYALGEEPEWVHEQRKADKIYSELFLRGHWSKEEDRKLMILLEEEAHTLSQLSVKMKRTEGAISKRIRSKKLKPLPMKTKGIAKEWTEEETEKLIAMYKNGYDYNVIARFLSGKRTVKAVDRKMEKLMKSGRLDSLYRKKGK